LSAAGQRSLLLLLQLLVLVLYAGGDQVGYTEVHLAEDLGGMQ
jgi:hypothetical protein